MILLTPYKRYYEQVDGQTTDITKEIPFDLPEGWTWARIRSILLQTGSKIPSGVYFDYIDIDAIDNSTNKITEPKHILVKDAPSRASREILPGDTLFSLVRPYLKNIALVEEAHRDYIASTGFYVCRPSCGANYRYLFYTMISDFTVNGINSFIKGDNSPSVRREDIEKFLFPLPPLTEQQRIVAQIESLLKCVDEIDRESETLEKSLTLAKQKILDLAIRGKLVQQDPTDEPASELLKKIKAEKDALVKAGKIKKDKHESFIFKGDDNCYYEQLNGETVDITAEIPFDLPESWSWCRLYSVVEICDNLRKPINAEERQKRIKSANNLYPYYGATGRVGWIDDFISDGEFVLLGEDGAPFLDPCTPKAYIICGKAWVNNHAHVLKGINNQFLCHCLNSVDYTNFITGTTRYKLTQAEMAKILLPTPPLAEQQRIVQAIAQYNSILELISK